MCARHFVLRCMRVLESLIIFWLSWIFRKTKDEKQLKNEESKNLQKFRKFRKFSFLSTNLLFQASLPFPRFKFVISEQIKLLYLQKQYTNFFIPHFSQQPMKDKLQHKSSVSKTEQQEPREREQPTLQPYPTKIQIQVPNKKKKEVISVESSVENVQSQEAQPVQPSDYPSSIQSKPAKQKKTTFRCQLCKSTGKKSEMKTCIECKNYAHLQCLDENEVKKKYTCDKCKILKLEQPKQNKKIKKQEEKIETEKAIQKRLQKQKKKDESNKTLEKFKVKYPYYVGEGDKIKFPIEDKLLFIYKEYFEPGQNRPLPIDHPLIPSDLLGDFMELENFITSFHREFQVDYPSGQHRKTILYALMNCEGVDKIFERLLGAIVKIYLKDIFEKNKTENVKILNDNCFFILLGIVNQSHEMTSDFVALVAAQIIRYLSTIPSMKNAFINFQFPEKFNLRTKLKTLITLIQGLCQVDGFHEMVGRRSQKIAELTKDKADFVLRLKKNEAQALHNKEKLKQILGKNEQAGGGENAPEQKMTKEIEKTKKKTQKMAIDGEKSDLIIKDFKSRIVKISKTIPFTISEVMFLGNDRNKASYYFYLRQPHRIYVRYRNYILDTNEEYKIYEGKEKIVEVVKSLNTKGIYEKHLYESINSLIKDEVLRNLTPEEQMEEVRAQSRDLALEKCQMFENESSFRQKVIDDILEIEEKFSNYLVIKSCQWAAPAKREEFIFGFPYIDSIHAMKEAVKNLQESFLFVEIVREREAHDSDSNNEDHNQMAQRESNRRKKPIRIWGINSQKVKKFWMEYMESCISYSGIWISTFIFKKYVDKYLEKKMEHIKEQERREAIERERQIKEIKMREERDREQEERNLDRLRSRNQPQSPLLPTNKKSEHQSFEASNEEGVRTRRRLRAETRSRNKALLMDSEEGYGDDIEKQNEEEEEVESGNQDECAICGEVGNMICCDTCPKVFHLDCLKIKEVPEGEWSCVECLERIANQRQTRSRVRRLKK